MIKKWGCLNLGQLCSTIVPPTRGEQDHSALVDTEVWDVLMSSLYPPSQSSILSDEKKDPKRTTVSGT